VHTTQAWAFSYQSVESVQNKNGFEKAVQFGLQYRIFNSPGLPPPFLVHGLAERARSISSGVGSVPARGWAFSFKSSLIRNESVAVLSSPCRSESSIQTVFGRQL